MKLQRMKAKLEGGEKNVVGADKNGMSNSISTFIFTLLFGRLRQRNWTKERAARAARLFFLIQPIRSLFSGIVFAVAVFA